MHGSEVEFQVVRTVLDGSELEFQHKSIRVVYNCIIILVSHVQEKNIAKLIQYRSCQTEPLRFLTPLLSARGLHAPPPSPLIDPHDPHALDILDHLIIGNPKLVTNYQSDAALNGNR
ncbi:hypothetical protein Fot_01702 [Forsythia ovata]|uniref:Uncharacterized protein n=1 Tax=Forsythia ovata TaxID=205694 RepID=A0ABD1X4Q4_9LAMI